MLRKPLQIKVAGINNEQVSVADLLIVYYQKGWQSDTVLYGIVIKENTDMSYYILSPSTQLCGYNKLPFGIYSARIMKTEFLNREQFAVLLDCDGNTDIDEKNCLTMCVFSSIIISLTKTSCPVKRDSSSKAIRNINTMTTSLKAASSGQLPANVTIVVNTALCRQTSVNLASPVLRSV